MIRRTQLPVWSPVDLRIIGAGAMGLVRGGGAARRELESRLREHFAASAVLTTDSGTSALALALTAAYGASGGLPVALPAYSCWDLVSAAAAANVRVCLYDVDPETLAPDPASLDAVLRTGVSAVVVVHLYGVPVPLDAIAADVAAAGALLIEDVAQAFGASLAGRPAGCAGDMTVMSFGRGKGLTGGSGGALLARGRAARMLTSMDALRRAAPAGAKDMVTLAALWALGRPSVYSLPASVPQLRLGETVYHPPRAPAVQSGVSAAAVSAAWSASLAEAAVRRSNAARLMQVSGHGLDLAAGVEPGFLRLPVLVRNCTLDPAERQLGILRGYPTALCDLPQLTVRFVSTSHSFTGARELAQRLVTVPVHSRLTQADLNGIEQWLCRVPRGAPITQSVTR